MARFGQATDSNHPEGRCCLGHYFFSGYDRLVTSPTPPVSSSSSGEPDPLPMRLASFWTRAAGRFVDLLIVNIAWVTGAAINTFWLVVASVFAVLWEFGWLVTRGATPGKLLMGARVVGADGHPVKVAMAALRSLDLAILAAIALISVGASGYARLYYITSMVLISLDSAHRRSLMDHLARTRVVKISTKPPSTNGVEPGIS